MRKPVQRKFQEPMVDWTVRLTDNAFEEQNRKFGPMAFRVRFPGGSTLVLCGKHLGAARSTRDFQFTGETFAVELCDDCYPEHT